MTIEGSGVVMMIEGFEVEPPGQPITAISMMVDPEMFRAPDELLLDRYAEATKGLDVQWRDVMRNRHGLAIAVHGLATNTQDEVEHVLRKRLQQGGLGPEETP